ncbi:MAG: penicillin-binding protein 2, partial [Clostridia bacterium]|nr:penicillin-binding protein 2 [Clostridia bacterium]
EIVEDFKQKISAQEQLYEPVKLVSNISVGMANLIREMELELPGVSVDTTPVRYYPYGDLLGSVLGYVREIDAAELEEYNKWLEENPDALNTQSYSMGDLVGKVGLEKSYEEYLRGEKGSRIVEVDSRGNPVRALGTLEASTGNSLKLTIDSRLQRAAQNAVQNSLNKARASGYVRSSEIKPVGSAVVLDVKTSKILAMASLPSYDLNIFSGTLSSSEYTNLSNSRALGNHAIQTVSTPGSTFKMVSSTAFLESGLINAYTSVYCGGIYSNKKCWSSAGHGSVNVASALKHSCDIFFYVIGEKAGPELIGQYAAEYGFGQITGVDLPNEEKGIVASKERKQELWSNHPDPKIREWESQWHNYDSMDMAIGQQETKVTALQLANYVACIANGGTLNQPYVVDQVVNSKGKIVLQNQPVAVHQPTVSQATLDILHQGMRGVVTAGGTAPTLFSGASYTAAGKSGTAELGDAWEHNNALFVSYAPYEDPEVAVAVIIEYGGAGGAVAGAAVRQIMDAYFDLKEQDANSREETGEEYNQPVSSNVGGSGSGSKYNNNNNNVVSRPSGTIIPPDNGNWSSVETYTTPETDDESEVSEHSNSN